MTWTFGSEVDLTNGGADDLRKVTLETGLSASLMAIQVFVIEATSGADNSTPILRLKGINWRMNFSDYTCKATNTTSSDWRTTGFYSAREDTIDASQAIVTTYKLYRWDRNEYLWFMNCHSHEVGSSIPRVSAGHIHLEGELTDLQLVHSAGAALFTGGTARVRYR